MKKRSLQSLAPALLLAVSLMFTVLGCGKNFYFAGRVLPPSAITNRVLIAVQNPSSFTTGTLVFVDAFYDIRHSFNNPNNSFSIAGYAGSEPVTIQNMPEEQTGAVYGSGDGSYSTVNYAKENAGTTLLPAKSPLSSSIFLSRDQRYALAANQASHQFTVFDRVLGQTFPLSVPGIYRVSLNAGGTLALGFVQNSDAVYSVVRLTQQQTVDLSGGPSTWASYPGLKNIQDCEPQNLPQYCAVQVAPTSTMFNRPIKAVFSSDGNSIFVLNCGPECGGSQAGIVTIPITAGSFNGNASGPAGSNLAPSSVLPIPGGSTDAIQSGNTFYVSGQQVQPDGLFGGNLTVVDLPSNAITATYSISDGTHTKMLFGDDNSLWIGSQRCLAGEKYAHNQAGASQPFGCLTLFNTATNAVTIDPYKGDLTGVTSVEGLHKIYVAEGGQVHIYNSADFTERDNTNVAITDTAYDAAYMDATSDADNANN
ncbi:MAG: hypothetical protein ACR2JE_02685 [Acidobacteriaceae bacterium]